MDSGLYLPEGLWEPFLKPQVPPKKERVVSSLRWLAGEQAPTLRLSS